MSKPRRAAPVATLATLLACALTSAPAGAVTYVSGQPIELLSGNCAPASTVAYYSQQTAPNSNVGIPPKVGEIFYVGVTHSFNQFLDCAADFWAAVLTLPPGVVPAVGNPDTGDGARPVCIRRAYTSQTTFSDDPRMATNCPTTVGNNNSSLSFNPMTRELRIGPKPGATFPDQSAASYFFIGQNHPAESLVYTKGIVLVPVKATQQVSAPMTALICTVGTTCASGSTVNMTVNAAEPPANVAIALGAEIQTSAESALLPLSVSTTTMSYRLRIAVREGNAFACGAANYQYVDVTDGGGTFEFRIGPAYDPPPIGCWLNPDRDHTFEVCHVTNTSTNAVNQAGCRSTAFRTTIVGTDFEPPEETAADRPDSTTMVFRNRRILTSHVTGQYVLQRKTAGSADGAYVNSAPTDAPESDAGGSDPDPLTWTGFTAWSAYDVRSCFAGPYLHCSPSMRLVAGHVTAPADATGVTHDSATVGGLPSAPWPAGTLSFRTSTTDPGAGDPREVMSEAAAVALAARAESTAGAATTGTLSGLAPATKYYWAACFDSPATAGIEDCSPPRSFTTAAAPGGSPTPSPSPTPGPGPGGLTPDTTKPKGSIRVKGRPRRGAKVRITVVATDAGGVAKVTIKLGSAKPRTGRTLTARLPRRGRRVKIVAVITDKAGNRTTVTKTLRLR